MALSPHRSRPSLRANSKRRPHLHKRFLMVHWIQLREQLPLHFSLLSALPSQRRSRRVDIQKCFISQRSCKCYLVYKMFSKSWKIASILAIIIFFEPLPRFAFNPGDPFKYLDFLPPSVYIANYWAGQSDAIILFLFTLSLYFLSKDKIFLSCLAYALSFVKPEPIVLL